jgi:ribosomal protein L11 methylase PrmA
MIRRRLQKQSISGWSPTPLPVITAALELAGTNENDMIYDLGCGDGRVVVRAAGMFGARSVGFDIDPKRVRQTLRRIRTRGIQHLASVRRRDLLSVADLHRATVIYLYLPQQAIRRLKPILRNRCQPGARIVSAGAWFHHWKTSKELMLRRGKTQWYIGLWEI